MITMQRYSKGETPKCFNGPEVSEMLFIPKQKEITILIVEDEKNIRELLKDILLPYYQVREAADGEEALKEVEQK